MSGATTTLLLLVEGMILCSCNFSISNTQITSRVTHLFWNIAMFRAPHMLKRNRVGKASLKRTPSSCHHLCVCCQALLHFEHVYYYWRLSLRMSSIQSLHKNINQKSEKYFTQLFYLLSANHTIIVVFKGLWIPHIYLHQHLFSPSSNSLIASS